MNSPLQAISLFSGCGGDTLGLTRAGFKVVAFNEFNKAAIQSHLANFPDSTLLADPTSKATDITKVPDSVFEPYKNKVNVVFAGFPCFVEGTPTLTNRGYVPIESVTLEHTLLTHTGIFQPIVNLQRKIYKGDLYSIKIRYHPEVIHATEEHPFYIRSSQRVWNKTTRRYVVQYGDPEWKKVSELKESDYFGMIVNTKQDTPTFTIPRKVNASRTDTITLVLNKPEQWFTMGYFVGDGWIEDTEKQNGNLQHKIRMAIYLKDRETVLPILQKVLPITDKQCNTGDLCSKFGCSDIIWYTIFKEFGKYAHGKRIPEWVQDAPTEFLEEFVKGYFAADGNTKQNGRLHFTTVSQNLAYGFQRILFKLGHVFSIQKTKRPSQTVIEGRVVNQRDTYELEGSFTKQRVVQTGFLENGYVWCKGYSIAKQHVEDKTVYNFEVQTDNSYIIANTIVHNCQGFSKAGKKKVTDPRNQMYNQFVRVAKVTKPEFIIGENVPGLTSMKSGPKDEDPFMLDLIKKAFKDIGYESTHQVLEATDFGVPQKRKRLLLIGWDTTKFPRFDPTSFWASVSNWGAQQTMPLLRSFVTTSMEDAYELEEGEVPEGFRRVALPLPYDGSRRTTGPEPTGKPHPFVTLKAKAKLLSCSKRVSPIHSEVVDLDKPSKTIICTYDHQPRLLVGLYKADSRCFVRTLLPQELKQIQGFPADYVVLGNQKEQVVQIGNAVPPALVQGVAYVLRSYVEPVVE